MQIDRGALVLAVPAEPGSYRGLARETLESIASRDPRCRKFRGQYREAIVEGDGVLEDLDVALRFREIAERFGLEPCEVVVFEVAVESATPADRALLPVAPTPPADGLVLAGYDVVELIEPFTSVIAAGGGPGAESAGRGAHREFARNDAGLLASERAAHAVARSENADRTDDIERVFAVRVWLAAL